MHQAALENGSGPHQHHQHHRTMSSSAYLDISTEEYAESRDHADSLASLRDDFIIPSRRELSSAVLCQQSVENNIPGDQCTYLCGNSLGLQPKGTQALQNEYLKTWAQKGVYGHFKPISDTRLPTWLDVDDDVRPQLASLVGARTSEVTAMQTLTANLHLAMATFYRPDRQARYKIILEGKAFPSDLYAVESQLLHHDIDPTDGMIKLEPDDKSGTISTAHILATIDAHASTTALLLLPGVQFYTGQYFDMKRITSHAQAAGITVGWDLAHAVGNVPLSLHDWNVDFAVWCSYKYLNSGPGCIAGLFIHDRHASATSPPPKRLAGWWGSSKTSRFAMAGSFDPIPGACGWQLSNPSVADLTSLRASLDVFGKTSMAALREKSIALTAYLVELLDVIRGRRDCFRIITPRDPGARGAQISVRLDAGLLETVMHVLEREGVVVDERRPDVIRIAPAPLYNSFGDVLRFSRVFEAALVEVENGGTDKASLLVEGGKEAKGWNEVK